MKRPVAHPIVAPHTILTHRVMLALFAVAALHLFVVYALMKGLAVDIARAFNNVVTVEVIAPPPPPEVRLPLPPPMPDAQPQMATVPPPLFRIEAPPSPRAITVVQAPPKAVPLIAEKTAHAVSKTLARPAIAPTTVRGIESTHTAPTYPPLARRLGEEGSVQVRIAIAATGAVTDVTVLRSSGHDRLDDAAREWVLKHWRYHPATRNSAPIASTTQAVIVFNLKTADAN